MFKNIKSILFVIFVLKSVINVAQSNKVKVTENTSTQNVDKIFNSEAGVIDIPHESVTHNSTSKLSRGKGRGRVEELSNPKNNFNSSLSANSENFTSANTTILSYSTTNVTKLATNNSMISLIPSSTLNSTNTLSTTSAKPSTSKSKSKPKKPTITKSADEDPSILANEKKVKFSNTKLDPSTPELEFDIDRTMENDKKAKHSYIFFMVIAFGLPMTITIIHIFYKKIKAYLEVRHYQRVVSLNCIKTNLKNRMNLSLKFISGLFGRWNVY
jgi:hypothetical protein